MTPRYWALGANLGKISMPVGGSVYFFHLLENSSLHVINALRQLPVKHSDRSRSSLCVHVSRHIIYMLTNLRLGCTGIKCCDMLLSY